ncbi:hypothetical protein ACOI1C_15780 [Bacillus sp. DJP31]|uniref:hypothetical protein n=1 Tax=Bacillus sp. DJP31 TaxID=3409789 RepID=UPI003BB7224B
MKVLIVLGTVIVEAVLIYVISLLLGWNPIDMALLGGLALFGLVWMLQMNSVQQGNHETGYIKGTTGIDAGGEIKVFRFKLNPIILGMILFIVISAVATFIYYKDYFIG